MNELVTFFNTYGLVLTLIAIAGIIVLGIMKYCNFFKKIDEKTRHIIYLIISISLSLIASLVYLLIINKFEITSYLIIASAIYALNQTFYTLFKTTSINKLGTLILDSVKSLFKSTDDIQDENTKKY